MPLDGQVAEWVGEWACRNKSRPIHFGVNHTDTYANRTHTRTRSANSQMGKVAKQKVEKLEKERGRKTTHSIERMFD